MSPMLGQNQEPPQPLASAPGVAAKVPREESWQIDTIAESAWPGVLSCSVPTATAGLCPYRKGN